MGRSAMRSRVSMLLSARGRVVARGVTAGLIAGLLPFIPVQAAAAAEGSLPPSEQSTPVTALDPGARPATPSMEEYKPQPVTWPTVGSAELDVQAAGGRSIAASVSVGGLPVNVGSAIETAAKAVAADQPTRVKVEVVDQAKARAAGSAVALRVSRADGKTAAGRVRVEVNYSAFRHAYGGDWDSRLGLVVLPACSLTTPEKPECLAGTRLKTVNNANTGVVSADVDLQASAAPQMLGAESTDAAPVAGSESIVALAASSGSVDLGTFAKTDFKSSYSWQAGQSGGEFGWSYPFQVPSVPGGLSPQVALGYSSGAVDGQTAGENVQPAWGEGWNYNPGYVERSYMACNGTDPNYPGDNQNSPVHVFGNSDMCWRQQNARMTLGGKSTELVLDTATGKWRAANDDGAKVELLTSGTLSTGTYYTEKWKVTTVDGTQYNFGLTQLPGFVAGDRETGSVWGMPVHANHSGEPCYTATKATSYCTSMAYRWNLDYVVDPNGNTMSLWYAKQANKTAVTNTATKTQSYTRAGNLEMIEYGTRAGSGATRESSPTATPPARVDFRYSNRCVTQACATHDKANWPDTPFDMDCASGATSCANNMGPSFWSTTRPSTVRTEVWSGSGTTYNIVDSWAITHGFPATGNDTSPVLWMFNIVRTAQSTGSPITLPKAEFLGEWRQNRADYDPDAQMPDPRKYRITVVKTETGGQIDVTYSGQDSGCLLGATYPSPDSNNRRCFPLYAGSKDEPADWGWWHKYIVTKVVEHDLVGGSPDVQTSYSYSTYGSNTNVLWGHDDGAAIFSSRGEFRSYGDWRGYPTVVTTTGTVAGEQSQTQTLYFRGLHGDVTDAGETARVSTITNTLGEVSQDEEQYAGIAHEVLTYASPDGQILSKKITNPTRYLTGTRTMTSAWAWPTKQYSYLTRTAKERNLTWLSGTNYRTTQTVNTWETTNKYGVLTTVDDQGDIATTADDVCVRYSYTFPSAAAPYLINYANRVEKVGVKCALTPTYPTDALSDTRTFYDNASAYTTAPTRGLATKTEAVASYTGTTPNPIKTSSAVYDQWGRPTSVKNGLDAETQTAYTHTAGLVSGIQVTAVIAPSNHVASTTVDRLRGLPLTVTDANGKVTTGQYDALGRLVKVWKPGHPTSGTPDAEFAYSLTNNAASYIHTKALGANGNQISSYEILDGLLRPRQTQLTAPDGKRSIKDTKYDTRGNVFKVSQLYNSAGAPASTLFAIDEQYLARQQRYTYDGVGRKTSDELWSIIDHPYMEMVHKTTFIHGGDRTAVSQPNGGTTTQEVFDARGHLIAKQLFPTRDINDTPDTTSYSYDRAGQLQMVTDAAGNQWKYEYDLLGRRTKTTDPDTGVSTAAYDVLGQLTTSTDSRGNKLAFTYDVLGRKTGMFTDSTAGTKRAEWIYDTVAKGQLSSSSRFDGAKTYTSSIGSYDDSYQPLSTTHVVPGFGAAGGTLTYNVNATYKTDGSVATHSLPGVGGLPAETLTYSYTDQGMPTSMNGTWGGGGSQTYVNSTTHTYDGLVTERWLGETGKRVKQLSTYSTSTRRLGWRQIATESQTTPGAVNPKIDAHYEYDQAGNITKVAGETNTVLDQVECFSYDNLRRLTKAWTETANTCATPQRTGADPYWREWTFDKIGNRKSQVDKDPVAGDTTWTYSHPASGATAVRPHTVSKVTATGPKSGTPTRDFGYDNGGNTTSRTTETGTAQTLTWDPEGHLATVTEGSNVTSYVYGPDGNRLIAKGPTTSTLYLADGSELELPNAGGTALGTRYYQHNGVGIGVRTSAGLQWTCNNHQGTAQAQIDAVTLQVNQRRTMPYGETRGTQPTWTGTKGYIGGTKDDTGLTHLSAREYDPTLGQFISRDPIMWTTDPSQLGGYGYGGASPINRSDPSGMGSLPCNGLPVCNQNPPPPGPSCGSCNPPGPPPGPGRPSPTPTPTPTPAPCGGKPGSCGNPCDASCPRSTPTGPKTMIYIPTNANDLGARADGSDDFDCVRHPDWAMCNPTTGGTPTNTQAGYLDHQFWNWSFCGIICVGVTGTEDGLYLETGGMGCCGPAFTYGVTSIAPSENAANGYGMACASAGIGMCESWGTKKGGGVWHGEAITIGTGKGFFFGGMGSWKVLDGNFLN